MAGAGSILDRRLSALLDDVAARTPAPGGGSVAAIAVAFAAALAEMAARFSDGCWASAAEAASRAAALRGRAVPLAQADADAYAGVLDAYRLPKADAGRRDEAIAVALEAAASVPLELAAIAAEVAQLAVEAAEQGNPNLRGDAATAAALAAAGADAAATLVSINLVATPGDERSARARRLAIAASEAAARVRDGSGRGEQSPL